MIDTKWCSVSCLKSSLVIVFHILLLWHKLRLFFCISVAEPKGISDDTAAHFVADINMNKNIVLTNTGWVRNNIKGGRKNRK